MGLNLKDCPPVLATRILAQLAKEGRHLPTIATTFAMATFSNHKWTVGPETQNYRLICSIVAKLQQQNGHTEIGRAHV